MKRIVYKALHALFHLLDLIGTGLRSFTGIVYRGNTVIRISEG